MSWIDWLILLLPFSAVVYLAFYARHYVRGVADYLAAGRVAGRYVIAVGDMENAFSVIVLVALTEQQYQCGFAMGFWHHALIPITMLVSLTGFCIYRFRETKALSAGQFLEMRYNRPFRIFAAIVRTAAEMTTNAIGPAVAARFFVYFLGLPHQVDVCGIQVQTFALIAFIIVALAVVLILPGGRVSLIITDCLQGIMGYPIFVIIAVFVLTEISWETQIIPAMANRIAGESFLNPYDVEDLRDFNTFALITSLLAAMLNRASWLGGDSSGAGRTAHEQKMAGVLGVFRNGFATITCSLIAILVITVMNHPSLAAPARKIRNDLIAEIAAEQVEAPVVRQAITYQTSRLSDAVIYTGEPLAREKNPDTVYLDAVHAQLGNTPEGNRNFQVFRSLYYQMMLPITIRNIMPVGLIGLFALLMVMLMVSTDDSRILNSSVVIIQDIIAPLWKKPLTPKQHLWTLRVCVLIVAGYFFTSTLLMAQMDYIRMFTTIISSVWLGGAGAVMVGGLYTRWGTTAGAFAAIISGATVSVGGFTIQRNWARTIYPWLERNGLLDYVSAGFDAVTAWLSPIIVWEMSPVKFPINSFEIYFMAMMSGLLAYIVFSLLTCRRPYNLERMLHRGRYDTEGKGKISTPWTWRNFPAKVIGITPAYTRGDKIIAWAVFFYSFVYMVIICFVVTTVWNFFSPWPEHWWSEYFLIANLIVPIIVGVVSTVWMGIGGIIDMRRLFKDLNARKDDPLDDGRVEGQVSLADLRIFDQAKLNNKN